jgi:DNA polymerase III psi subunit
MNDLILYPMDAYFLSQLFPEPLFIGEQASASETAADFRKVVVLIQAIEQVSPLQQLLHDILRSCKLNPQQDVLILTVESGAACSWKQIQQTRQPTVVLLFGVMPADLDQAAFSRYQPVLLDKTHVLYADTLAMLHEDKSRKKLLWQALKDIFF